MDRKNIVMNQRNNYGFHRNWATLLSFNAIYLPDAHFYFPTKNHLPCSSSKHACILVKDSSSHGGLRRPVHGPVR